MWEVDDEMQVFKALPYRDKVRVSRCLARGEAPDDPQRATAAVELAESYQRKSPSLMTLMRWLPAIMIIFGGIGLVLDALEGDYLGSILYALFALIAAIHFMINPATRPKNMARALEGSRLIASAGSAPLRLSQFDP